MSRKSRMKSLRESKDRRAKKLAVGGAVLLAVVIAFEVPKVLNHGKSSSSTPPAATTTASDTTGAVAAPATTAPATVAAVMPTASTPLPNSDMAPARSKSTLYSFSHFAGKDPFVPQVVDSSASLPQGDATAATSSPSTNVAEAAAVTHASTGPAKAAAARALAVSGAVRLQVNGSVESVRVGASFPSSDPLFRLVSVTQGVAKIAIANGSYASGAGTVSLTPGRSLTLVDTADGIRYKIRLLSAS